MIAHTKCGAGTLASQDPRTSLGTSAMLGIEKVVECFCFHSINRSVKKIPDRLNQLSFLVARLKYARTRKIEGQHTAMIPEHDHQAVGSKRARRQQSCYESEIARCQSLYNAHKASRLSPCMLTRFDFFHPQISFRVGKEMSRSCFDHWSDEPLDEHLLEWSLEHPFIGETNRKRMRALY